MNEKNQYAKGKGAVQTGQRPPKKRPGRYVKGVYFPEGKEFEANYINELDYSLSEMLCEYVHLREGLL